MAPIVIGIGGVTCGGKSTLCRRLVETLSSSDVTVIALGMDDYYLDDLHMELKNTVDNWDCVEAIDFQKLAEDLENLIEATNNEKSQAATGHFNDGTGTKNDKPQSFENKFIDPDAPNIPNGIIKASPRPPVVILLDGIMIYQYPPLRKYFNLRYFITLTEQVARERRLERRYTYTTGEEVIFDRLSYFERYAWPCYLESLRDIESQLKDGEAKEEVKFLDGTADISVNCDLMLRDITDLINKAPLHSQQSLGS